ncbi:MAG: hypothetical protein KDC87_15380 [Planctomycetes bacterium]|nr:hypothetical protein [Planctomycetota bacterium]
MSSHAPVHRPRRLWVGPAVALGTAVVLVGVVEVVARTWVVPELLSFLPIYAADEVAGYRLKSGVDAYAFGARVRTNSVGFRGPEWSRVPAPGVLRIALIGDSLAFGFGVAFEQTVGEALARRIARRCGRACEVLNFGVPGYNAAQQLAVLERLALPFRPQLVLVLPCSNDHEPALWVDDEGAMHWGERGQPGTHATPRGVPRRARWGVLRHSGLAVWIKSTWLRWQADRTPVPQGHWMGMLTAGPVPSPIDQRVLLPLRTMYERCAAQRIPMVVGLFAGDDRYRLALRELVARTGVPALELLELFPEAHSWAELCAQFSLGWDSHPNAEAYARWANGLFELLEKHRLLPSK